MNFLKNEIAKEQIMKKAIMIVIAVFIICGNALTFNFGKRLPLKLSEIISVIFVGMAFIFYGIKIFKFNSITKFIKNWLIIGTIFLMINIFIQDYQIKGAIYSMFYTVRLIFICVLINVIINLIKKYNIDKNKIINLIINCFFIVCLIGFFQLIVKPNAFDWYEIFKSIGVYIQNPDPHVGRLVSTYFDPNYLAAILTIPATICLNNWIKSKKNIKDLIKFGVFALTIILTVSRSGILIVAISCFIVTLKQLSTKENGKRIYNKKVLFIYACVVVVLLVMLIFNVRIIDRIFNTMSDPSTFFRVTSWKNSLNVIKENILIGIGYNAIGIYGENSIENAKTTSFGSDSSLLLVVISTGLIGTFYFAIGIIKKIINLLYSRKSNSIVLLGILVSVLIGCNFNNLLFYILWLFPVLLLFTITELEKEEKNVVIDARMINMSGIGTYIKNLVKNDCYDKALGNREELSKYFKNDDIIEYNSKIYGIKEQIRFPYCKLWKLNPTVLHVPHYNIPILYNGRMIVTIHDLTHLILPEFLPSKFAYYYAKFMIFLACIKCEKIFTVSENTKRDIIKYFKVPEEKIIVTYNGVGEEFKNKEKEEINYLYEKFNIPENKKIIMYVGNLKPHKNLERLIRAFAKIEDKSDKVLLLVGKAFEKYSILDDVEKELGIKENVIHTGVVSQQELVDLYNLAELFVFPSLYEGFGLPILEALKCGTPVISSNNSSLPEVGGNLVDYFDAYNVDEIKEKIETNINNKQNLEYIKIEKWTKKFDWNIMAKEVKKTLE